MLFRDLPDCGSSIAECLINLDANGVNCPHSVFEQFYAQVVNGGSHNDIYIDEFGDLDLRKLRWSIIDLPLEELISIVDTGACVLDQYARITSDETIYNVKSGYSVNACESYADYWNTNGTWKTPPIIMKGSDLEKTGVNYYLCDGHTRIGILHGIATSNCFELKRSHRVYMAEML